MGFRSVGGGVTGGAAGGGGVVGGGGGVVDTAGSLPVSGNVHGKKLQ